MLSGDWSSDVCSSDLPVCGVLFSWWLLGENPGAVEGSGIVLIVLALALVSRKKKEAVSVKSI